MQSGAGRRLTGPSWWLSSPGAAVEIAFADGDDADQLFATWCERVTEAATQLGWPAGDFARTTGAACATWAFAAPVDQLSTAADVAEAACGLEPLDFETLRHQAQAEAQPHVRAWLAAAEASDLPWLLDDDGLTIGLGAFSQTWLLSALSETPPSLSHLRTIPHVLVTGTNGKTTTARMLARILRHHGLFAGNTSTDGLMLDGQLVTPGDWTGPGGARHVLRNLRVQAAALETARGGLLRRGLASRWADGAVVTNVSDDHLDAQVGSEALMAEAKLAIRKGIRPGGLLILNASCAPLVTAARRLRLPDGPFSLAWFAASCADLADLPGQIRAWSEDDALVMETAAGRHVIARLEDIPATFAGHAPHNVANALAAALAAHAMAIPAETIASGLAAFGSTVADNPGRANVLHLNGATILVDFAHNPDGVRQLAALVDLWPSTQRTLLIGQAGDRTDELMHALVQATLAFRPSRIVLKDTDHYLRGRQKGEIPLVLRRYYLQEGVAESALTVTEDELTGVAETLLDARPGHLLILLIHDDFPSAIARLRAAGATEA